MYTVVQKTVPVRDFEIANIATDQHATAITMARVVCYIRIAMRPELFVQQTVKTAAICCCYSVSKSRCHEQQTGGVYTSLCSASYVS